MSESMRSHEEPIDESFDERVVTDDSSELLSSAEVITGQFLTQCRHASVAPKEDVASFILASLSDETDDEFIHELRRQPIDTTDEQFDTLLETDEVFFELYDLAIRLKSIVGRGESMSTERKALIALMDLRAGEVIRSHGEATENSSAWRAVIAKLFPDLTK